MKKNFYLFQEEISPQIYLHYNSFSNEFLLLNKTKHEIFNNIIVRILRNLIILFIINY